MPPYAAVLAVTVNFATTTTILTPATSAGGWQRVGGEFNAVAGCSATFAIINANLTRAAMTTASTRSPSVWLSLRLGR